MRNLKKFQIANWLSRILSTTFVQKDFENEQHNEIYGVLKLSACVCACVVCAVMVLAAGDAGRRGGARGRERKTGRQIGRAHV